MSPGESRFVYPLVVDLMSVAFACYRNQIGIWRYEASA